MFDIAVVGAGPAGSTFARLVGQRYKVLLIDKRTFPDPQLSYAPGKCCGGLLAPDAQRMLSSLGLGLPKSVLEEPQLFVVRAIDIPRRIERYYQRHYINIHRQKFDRWLVQMIPPQVDVRLVTLSHLESTFSLGYAWAFEGGEQLSDEFMVSLKILR